MEDCGPDILDANFLIRLKLQEVHCPLKELNENIMGDESSVKSIVKNGEVVPGYYSSILQINPFHLAIIAQQYRSVKCILDYIFTATRDKDKEGIIKRIKLVFSQKTLLEKPSMGEIQFSKYDQSMNYANAFHLSCQFYPDALQIFNKTLSNQLDQFSSTDREEIAAQIKLSVNAKTDAIGITPLHIAAKKSLTQSAR